MKTLFFLPVLGLILLLSNDFVIQKNNKDSKISKLMYYDNSRVYKVNPKNHRFYVIADFRKKKIT